MAVLRHKMPYVLQIKSNKNTDFTAIAATTSTATLTLSSTNYIPLSSTPPYLSRIGLGTIKTMSERQRLIKLKIEDDIEKRNDDELFVKRPNFNKRKGPPLEIPKTMENENQHSSDSDAEELDENFPSSSHNPVGRRLYNFLQYLSAHRWLWFEFLESFVDKPIFAAAYDVNRFIYDFCPQLKTRQLPRRGWQLIRRIMGKARRFSTSFINQERLELERARRIIRELQLGTFNKLEHYDYLDEIPRRIPLPLSMGGKVTTFIFQKPPTDKRPLVSVRLGLRDGLLVGHKPQDSTYLIELNIKGKSKLYNVPDYGIFPVQDAKSLALSIIMQEIDSEKPKPVHSFKGHYENYLNSPYSKSLLSSIIKIESFLEIKKKTVHDIATINSEFELSTLPSSVRSSAMLAYSYRRDSKTASQREEVQRRYASNMITLYHINGDILESLHTVHAFLYRYNKAMQAQHMECLPPSQLYQQARSFAELDMKMAEKNSYLPLGILAVRELLLNLQTILYLCDQLDCNYNKANVDAVFNDVVANMLATLPSVLSVQFKNIIRTVEPLLRHMAKKQQQSKEKSDQLMQLRQLQQIHQMQHLNQQEHYQDQDSYQYPYQDPYQDLYQDSYQDPYQDPYQDTYLDTYQDPYENPDQQQHHIEENMIEFLQFPSVSPTENVMYDTLNNN